jgi:hypothetical protein
VSTSSTGNAASTATTASNGGADSALHTLFLNPGTRVSESRFEEIVVNVLHKISIAELENILERRRREGPT